jgi:hypothetical protein
MKAAKVTKLHVFPIDSRVSCISYNELRDFSEDTKYKIKLFLRILQRNVR